MKLSPKMQDAKKELAYQHSRIRPVMQNTQLIMETSFEVGFDAAVFLYEQTIDQLKEKYLEVISYLPKVPTQPYEKQLAEDLQASQARETKLMECLTDTETVNQSLDEKIDELTKDLLDSDEVNNKMQTSLLESEARCKMLADVLSHALALGYLGEGSTMGWAQQALEAYEASLKLEGE